MVWYSNWALNNLLNSNRKNNIIERDCVLCCRSSSSMNIYPVFRNVEKARDWNAHLGAEKGVIGRSAELLPPDLFFREAPNSIPYHRAALSCRLLCPGSHLSCFKLASRRCQPGTGGQGCGDPAVLAPLSLLSMTSSSNWVFLVAPASTDGPTCAVSLLTRKPPLRLEFHPKSFGFLVLITPSLHVLSVLQVVVASHFSWRKSEYVTHNSVCLFDIKIFLS